MGNSSKFGQAGEKNKSKNEMKIRLIYVLCYAS